MTSPVIYTRRNELAAFTVLAVVLAPVLAVGIVGGYGFAIWMYQLVNGPPSVSTTNH